MDSFLIYAQLGFDHIIDSKGYDHILFVISLTVLYSIKDWKKILILVTAFTIGHSLTLALSVLDIMRLNTDFIESLIVLSIAITSLLNVIRGGKTPSTNGSKLYYTMALIFGLVHGMGFANYLNAILGKSQNIITPLLGFNLGLELGQIIIVSFLLIISLLFDIVFKYNKQKFASTLSAIVFGITIPMLIEFDWNSIFN